MDFKNAQTPPEFQYGLLNFPIYQTSSECTVIQLNSTSIGRCLDILIPGVRMYSALKSEVFGVNLFHRICVRVKSIATLIIHGHFWLLHQNAPVQLNDFVLIGGHFFDDPMEMIDAIGQERVSPLLTKGQFYPLYYNSNPRTLDLLRESIKILRPNCVVETGVANGVSTRLILQSFREFELSNSKLYSFDIDPKVFSLELEGNSQFNKQIIDSPSSFLSAFQKIGNIDLFYHDSDHSYENQLIEYNAAWDALSDNGLLISDDVNWSNAFLDFCKKVNRAPLLLSDSGKFCGMISKSTSKN